MPQSNIGYQFHQYSVPSISHYQVKTSFAQDSIQHGSTTAATQQHQVQQNNIKTEVIQQLKLTFSIFNDASVLKQTNLFE